MMASPTDKPLDSTHSDDLRKIKGIGRVKQQWFRDVFQIHTFQDFAKLSADAIATHLKADGQSASLHEIESWLEQARDLAQQANSEPAADPSTELYSQDSLKESDAIVETQETEPLQDSLDELLSNEPQSLSTELAETLDPNLEEEGIASDHAISTVVADVWNTDAAYLIEFQSRLTKENAKEQRVVLHYLENNEVDTLHTIEQGQWQPWLLEHLNHNVEPKVASSTSPTVKPLQVKAFQPSQSTITLLMDGTIPLAGSIKSKEPFSLEITFQVLGISAADVVEPPLHCTAQLYARNRSSKEVIALGCKEFPTWSQQSIYKIVLPKLTLSHPGAYRLQILALLQGSSATPGCFEIPVLNVV